MRPPINRALIAVGIPIDVGAVFYGCDASSGLLRLFGE
jgi:hypothetical protein